MNILLINHYAGSIKHGMEYRPYYLAREWVRNGHNVSIVAASYSHLRQIIPIVKTNFKNELVDGIRYLWIRTPYYENNDIKRVINICSFLAKLTLYANKIAKETRPDIVIASSTYPLDIYPARIISNLANAKLIFEVHDLWPLSPTELGQMNKLNPFIILMEIAEGYAYRKAAKVISILPKSLDYMIVRGLDRNKFVHIPNGIDTEEWQNVDRSLPDMHESIIGKLKKSGYFLICYAGSFGLANAIEFLVEAAAYTRDLPIAYVLVGQGVMKQKIQKYTEENRFENIYFLPPVPKTSIPSLLRNMDSLYIGSRKNSIYRFGISPNKLFDYMMAGKPIIHAVEAANDPVTEAGCGISVRAEDPIAIAEAIKRLISMPADVRLQMGQNGRDYVKKYHDYKVLAKKFMDVMNDLVKKS